MLFLLQVAENKISLFSLLQKGGYIMYPLYLLLVIAIYVFFERMIAIKKAGILPIVEPIRGGTDGSRLSFLGLPAPNIFTGMQAIHSKHEWIGVSDMQKSVEVLVNLVEIF